jgi:hypothetical protein
MKFGSHHNVLFLRNSLVLIILTELTSIAEAAQLMNKSLDYPFPAQIGSKQQ